MTDLRSTLSRVAGDPLPDARAVDEDLARGRRALRHRRTAQGAGALVLVTAAAGVAVTSRGPGAPRVTAAPTATLPSTAPPTTTAPTRSVDGVRLVAFKGSQPSGYEVAYVPQGWEIQAAYPVAMVIAPIGFKDQEQYSFEGKLVVMLRSASDTGEPVGDPIRVGHGTGFLNRQAGLGILVLTYRDTKGHWVQVQVPPSLHWSDDEIGRFAAGVVVTSDAQAGLG
ncbi:MAG TPA: hypothetical protein VF519_09805 [Mycobacteriales bacterium]|jgi:hypothetical protein